jgi:hypothetical protein
MMLWNPRSYQGEDPSLQIRDGLLSEVKPNRHMSAEAFERMTPEAAIA